jgi:hypothetical protein
VALSRDEIKKLKRGQTLRVVKEQGQGDNHLVAKGFILGTGTVGCSLKVTEVLSIGDACPETHGRVVKATFAELELLV